MRRILLAILLLMFSTIILTGLPPEKEERRTTLYRVGLLSSSDFRLSKFEGLKEGLKNFGMYEGENIEFIVNNAKGIKDDLINQAQSLVESEVQVIVTTGRVETEAAKQVTRGSSIPVLFMGLTALKHDGLVKNLLTPSEGLTGIQNDHAALTAKRLELLTKLLPGTKRVLLIYDPRVVPTSESLQAAFEAARKIDIDLQSAPASTLEDIRKIFQSDHKDIDAALLLPSFFLESRGANLIASLAMEKKLPVMGVEESDTAQLFAYYGVPLFEQGKQAARILVKIIRGQKVEDIPVEPPTNLKLTVNLDVAKKLGTNVNKEILGFAEVIFPEAGDRDEK